MESSEGEHKVRLTRRVAQDSESSINDISGLKQRRANTRFAPTVNIRTIKTGKIFFGAAGLRF